MKSLLRSLHQKPQATKNRLSLKAWSRSLKGWPGPGILSLLPVSAWFLGMYLWKRGMLYRGQYRRTHSLYHWGSHQSKSSWENSSLMKWHTLVGTTTVLQGLEQRWPHLLSHTSCLSGAAWPTLAFSCMSKSPPQPWSSWPWSQVPRTGAPKKDSRMQQDLISRRSQCFYRRIDIWIPRKIKVPKYWLKLSREQSEDGVWPPSRWFCKGKLASFSCTSSMVPLNSPGSLESWLNKSFLSSSWGGRGIQVGIRNGVESSAYVRKLVGTECLEELRAFLP